MPPILINAYESEPRKGIQFSSVACGHVPPFATPWITQHARLPCPSPTLLNR